MSGAGEAFGARSNVVVVGAGIMGAGIAQVAAQAGHEVLLYDSRAGAAALACGAVHESLNGLVAKGKRSAQEVADTMSRLKPVESLDAASGAALVIEAIVENLDAKRTLFKRLEEIVPPTCILATNTSSISVTAIANGLARPGNLVGMHFFNPVPIMRLVEVVAGLRTDPEVATAIYDLALKWGKVPVHTRSTPGFIVNRVARPFYAETLSLLSEQAAEPQALDACLRAAGFRMGPCELMDLIGHDTNFAVTSSVYEANFFDKRYVPSLVQRELVEGGLLGRKSGQGFFSYARGVAPSQWAPTDELSALPTGVSATVHGREAVSDRWADALRGRGIPFARDECSEWVGLSIDGAQLRMTDGRCAGQLQLEEGTDVAVFDWPMSGTAEAPLAWASAASKKWVDQVPGWLMLIGVLPCRTKDTPGLVVARTLAMLINEAADAVHQGVCSAEAVDAAMKLGVNYPAGPFDWLAHWEAPAVIAVLSELDGHYRGERYRISPELQRRAWAHRQLAA